MKPKDRNQLIEYFVNEYRVAFHHALNQEGLPVTETNLRRMASLMLFAMESDRETRARAAAKVLREMEQER